jgi:hypothetical protein
MTTTRVFRPTGLVNDAGYREIADGVYVSEREVVVLGVPFDTEDETHPLFHNCDAMGCGSVGPHVVLRARLAPETRRVR